MLRKNSETFMLSKAQREYFNHPFEPEAHAPLEQTHHVPKGFLRNKKRPPQVEDSTRRADSG
jgi:hypothetical protein